MCIDSLYCKDSIYIINIQMSNTYSIELSLTPALYPYRTLKSNHTTVAVDILRATSAICAALSAGVEEIIPLDSIEQLPYYRDKGYLIAAERGGKKLMNAECGNSPTEYQTMDLHGKRMAYSTTNGTVCIKHAADADRILVGSFSNFTALCNKLTEQPQDLVILCSGWQQDFSLEDTVFAGALIERLLLSQTYTTQNDAAMMALDLWRMAKYNPYDFCCKASHVHRLQSFGCEDDIDFVFQQDTCAFVPVFANGHITIDPQ